jgi:glutathione S-transferase
VISVLDLGLETSGTGWLVGDKCTFADLSFVTWNLVGEGLLKELGKLQDLKVKYPSYAAWMDALCKREDVGKIRDRMAKGRAEHGLG